jgi:hypothetical protein
MDDSGFGAVQQALMDLDFPASKDAIVRHAQDRGERIAEHLRDTG